MKLIKNYIVFLFIVLGSFYSCNEKRKPLNEQEIAIYQCPMKCEGEKVFHEPGTCSICKMDLALVVKQPVKIETTNEISENSIFNLTTKWNTEEGETILLEELKGKTLVAVMIYTSCKAACPRLVADMRNIEDQIPADNIDDVHFVLISIDPETDTPKRLKEFAIENYMDEEQWTFLQGSVSGVRELANVLAVKYKEISPLDFSHSNIISVFNREGELVHQQEGLGVDNKETVSKIIETSKK